jgi:hypothetical protein
MVEIARKFIVKLKIWMKTNVYLSFRGFVPVSYVEYLFEDGWKRQKHVEGLLYDCKLLYLTVVQLLE